MIDIVFTSVVLLALMFAWKNWKITMREVARDGLFDLRDKWRLHWIENDMDMSHPHYGYVRKRINQCLRNTADWRFVDMNYVSAHIKHIAPTVDAYLRHNDPRQDAPDRRTAEYAEKVRNCSIDILRMYMMTTSLTMFPAVVIVAGAIIIKTMAWDVAIAKALDTLSELFPVGRSKTIESAVTLWNFGIS